MRIILPWVVINGALFPKDAQALSVLDSSVQSGYGVFTTLKVREGIPLFFAQHSNRLRSGMQELSIAGSLSTDLSDAVRRVIVKNNTSNCAIRITVIAGQPNASLPIVIVHATTLGDNKKPINVITVPDTRDHYKTIKTINRIPHLLAMLLAEKQQAKDALFCQDNFLVESTIANIFSLQGNKVVTPPIKDRGLNGITRQLLLQHIPAQEQEIPLDTTDPLLLVNCLGIHSVARINGKAIRQDEQFVKKIRDMIHQLEEKYA